MIVHVADMGSWVMEMKKSFLSVLKTYMEVMNSEQITSLFYCFDSCWSRRPDQGQDAVLPIELYCHDVQQYLCSAPRSRIRTWYHVGTGATVYK
jgi:hypothetical protein